MMGGAPHASALCSAKARAFGVLFYTLVQVFDVHLRRSAVGQMTVDDGLTHHIDGFCDFGPARHAEIVEYGFSKPRGKSYDDVFGDIGLLELLVQTRKTLRIGL